MGDGVLSVGDDVAVPALGQSNFLGLVFSSFILFPNFLLLSAIYELLEVYFGRSLKLRCTSLNKWLAISLCNKRDSLNFFKNSRFLFCYEYVEMKKMDGVVYGENFSVLS